MPTFQLGRRNKQREGLKMQNVSEYFRNVFLRLWLRLPPSLRLKVYKLLKRLGEPIWGSATPFWGVQRLPFGLYLKGDRAHPQWLQTLTNEYTSLELVRKYTTIPVPRPVDLIFTDDFACLITTRIPGKLLGEHVVRILEKDDKKARTKLIRDLRDLVAQLGGIPNRHADSSGMALCNSYGRPLLDCGLDRNQAGPFTNESEFNDALEVPIAPHLKHTSNHGIHFTHSDLNMRNILVQDGEISGVLDWELSGWFPEYWEYIKCYYSEYRPRWRKIVDEVFAGLTGKERPYEAEEIERGLREFLNPY